MIGNEWSPALSGAFFSAVFRDKGQAGKYPQHLERFREGNRCHIIVLMTVVLSLDNFYRLISNGLIFWRRGGCRLLLMLYAIQNAPFNSPIQALFSLTMKKNDESKLLSELLGSQLSSVEFVQDYLQLRFDGLCINVYNPLTVRTEQREITSWNNGFRDLLCKQIAKVVNHVTFESQKELRILFTDTSEVVISLRNSDYTSAEAIYCHGFEDEGWFSE